MNNFASDRKYIENEFEQAAFDKSTGLSPEDLILCLREIQESQCDIPRPLVCANAYSLVLNNVQLEINEHTPFSVKINIGVDYSYFASKDIFHTEIYSKQREKILSQKFPDELQKARRDRVTFGTYTDFWHTVPNWNKILKIGFVGILQEAEESKERLLNSENYEEKQIVFLDSVIICYKAILKLLNRIYDYSLKFNVPKFSDAIKRLSASAPKTLYEAMLLSVLYLYFEEIGCERGRTLGDIDRLYLPYYENDLKNGATKEELDDLFRYFFIHFTATKRFAEQPFTIGGSAADGRDLSNELTLHILDIYDELDIYDPKIHLRYNKNSNEKLLEKAASMIRKGHSSICIMNDEAVFAGYERLGIPRKDSQGYVVLGCYEPIIMGLEHGEIGAAWLNMVKAVEFAINGGKDILTNNQSGIESRLDIKSFEEFFDVFLNQLKYYIDLTIDFAQRQGELCTLINPSPIYSSTFSECLQKGLDIHEYALKYNNMGIKLFGLATVVDSLTAIKKFVFDNKEVTLEEMRNALKSDFRGYEELQNKLSRDKDKYGNNLPLPDGIMVRLVEFLDREYCGKTLMRGSKLRLGLDSIDICAHLGKKTAATPDGRHAETSVSKNLAASDGKDRGGITAYMQTLLKIDCSTFVNSAPCDFILHPSAVEGEKGLKDFISLIKIFFAQGGFALQGNIFNAEMLKQAQKDPEKYSTLQVRVCGWNEYFVKLTKEMQDKFIKQCEVDSL